MTLDPGKFQARHIGLVTSYQYSDKSGYMYEGASYAEYPYDGSAQRGEGTGAYPQQVAIWTMPSQDVIPAGVYQLKTKVCIGNDSSTTVGSYAYAGISAGGTAHQSANSSALTEFPTFTEVTFDITVSADMYPTDGAWRVYVMVNDAGGGTKAFCQMNYDGMEFGVKDGETGLARTPFNLTQVYYPLQGTHENPTISVGTTPDFKVDVSYVYPEDAVTLVKYEDTLSSQAHSISNPTTQTIGDADSVTTGYSLTRRGRKIECSADSTRKLDAGSNTFYVLTFKDSDGGAVGTVEFEMSLDAKAPQLTTLNGLTDSTYVTLDDFLPYVRWMDPNSDSTHWRVKVYRNSDDVEMWDSGETSVGAYYCQIPDAANLVTSTVYYVIVTVMKGSGGSEWEADSKPGYFVIDKSETAVKITSHQGTADLPTVITDSTPTVEWTFGRAQSAFSLSIVDESDKSTVYNSGWVTSATKSHTVTSALDYGEDYSIQVQVKDPTQAHVYSSDERAYIHTNEATVPAPTLSAEPNTNHLATVTLAWNAPAINDGDDLTYEVSITGTASGLETIYKADSATSLEVGYMPIDTYTWKVRATDEHGVVGSWSSTDVFIVSDGGVVPVCHLVTSAPQVAPFVTSWRYTDQDGDVQTKYQVQLSTVSNFSSLTENSGEVTSTALTYTHTTTSARTYYRRARVYTGSSWSAWDTDQITILAATNQSDEVSVYLTAEGTPVELDQDTYPISGMTVSFRANSPAEASWVCNNFDADEAGVDDDEEVLIYLKDSDGKRITFRGAVTKKDVGDTVTFTARDIARNFDVWRVTRHLSMMSLGQIIAAIVEDPGENCATGITAHCEEINTDTGVVTLPSFDGAGKTLGAWLADFQNATGYSWRIEYLNGGYHFYWYNPSSQPTHTVTLKDSVLDRASNSSSQWRISDNIRVVKDRSKYANRITFTGIPDPPLPPGGVTDFDTLWTEGVGNWARFESTYTSAPSADSTYKSRGTYSVNYSWALAGAGTYPRTIPLGYRRLPAQLQDMWNHSYGYLRAKIRITMGSVGPQYSNIAGNFAPTSSTYEYLRPHIRPVMYLFTSEGAISGYANMTIGELHRDGGSHMVDCPPNPNWAGSYDTAAFRSPGAWCDWSFALPRSGVQLNSSDGLDVSQFSHVLAVGFGLNVDAYRARMIIDGGLAPEQQSSDGIYTTVREVCMQIDDMRIDSVPVSDSPLEMYVESAAVTAGSEAPIEAPLGVSGLNTSSARSLATLMLTDRNRTQQSIQSVEVDGIRNVPLRSQVTLNLTSRGISSTTLALYDIKYYPLDSGDKTEISVGDPKMDVQKALAQLRQKLDTLVTS